MKNSHKLKRALEKAAQAIQAGERMKAFSLLQTFCDKHRKDAGIRREIGIFFQQNDMPIKAQMFYRDSLRLNERQAVIYFNLGVIHQNMGQTKQAIECYQQAVSISDDYMMAHANLGYLYKQVGELEKCREACLKAQALAPEDPQVRHMIAALGIEEAPEVADKDYIRNLYDNYAANYDTHLSVTLKSRVPELIYRTVARLTDTLQNKRLLDLGCGTGICGERFAGAGLDHMEGIDLSEKMIEQAATKNVYSQLHVGDINEFLEICTDSYDIIVSSDVLIYFGSLQTVFSGAGKLLRTNGLLVFSVESLLQGDDDYILDDTGRYKHNHRYIENLAKSFHLDIISSAETALRQQNRQDVIGRIYALRQSPSQNNQ